MAEYLCPIIGLPCIRPGEPRRDLGFEHLTNIGFCGGEKPESEICFHAREEITKRAIMLVRQSGNIIITKDSLVISRRGSRGVTAYSKTGIPIVSLEDGK